MGTSVCVRTLCVPVCIYVNFHVFAWLCVHACVLQELCLVMDFDKVAIEMCKHSLSLNRCPLCLHPLFPFLPLLFLSCSSPVSLLFLSQPGVRCSQGKDQSI